MGIGRGASGSLVIGNVVRNSGSGFAVGTGARGNVIAENQAIDNAVGYNVITDLEEPFENVFRDNMSEGGTRGFADGTRSSGDGGTANSAAPP